MSVAKPELCSRGMQTTATHPSVSEHQIDRELLEKFHL